MASSHASEPLDVRPSQRTVDLRREEGAERAPLAVVETAVGRQELSQVAESESRRQREARGDVRLSIPKGGCVNSEDQSWRERGR